MGIDCGKPDDNSLITDKPSLVVEVLSPTTGGFDVTIKLAEYQGVPSLDYILFVDTENPTIHLYRRGNGGLWLDEVLKGLDAVVELSQIERGKLVCGILDYGNERRSEAFLVR